MPAHDWTRVSAGTFHDFHCAWIIHLKEALNDGLLPPGYYAQAEQHGRSLIGDVLTLHLDTPAPASGGAGLVLALAPPRVDRHIAASPEGAARTLRRTLAIRHASNHRIVAILEVLSPANKDRARSVADCTRKIHSAIDSGCHVLMVDLFPPGAADPQGMHVAIWESYGDEVDEPSLEKPVTLAAYAATAVPEALFSFVALGDPLPDIPLFLDLDSYINVPLEATYQASYRGVPAVWRATFSKGANCRQRTKFGNPNSTPRSPARESAATAFPSSPPSAPARSA